MKDEELKKYITVALEELKNLSMDIGVDYETFAKKTKEIYTKISGKVRSASQSVDDNFKKAEEKKSIILR